MLPRLTRLTIPISAHRLRLSCGLDSCTYRCLHATPWASRTVKEKISEVADKANKKVGKGLASAIETGEKVTKKTRRTLGATTKRVKGMAETAKEGADQMEQKANQTGNAKETGAKQKDL